MTTSKDEQQTEFTEEEQKKRDKLLRKILKTPPKPREKMKKGKARVTTNRQKSDK